MDNMGSGFGEVVSNANSIFTTRTGGDERMVKTNNEAELKNCIQNAQHCMMDMGKMIENLPGNTQERGSLQELCKKTGVLLEEAKQRCQQIL